MQHNVGSACQPSRASSFRTLGNSYFIHWGLKVAKGQSWLLQRGDLISAMFCGYTLRMNKGIHPSAIMSLKPLIRYLKASNPLD